MHSTDQIYNNKDMYNVIKDLYFKEMLFFWTLYSTWIKKKKQVLKKSVSRIDNNMEGSLSTKSTYLEWFLKNQITF